MIKEIFHSGRKPIRSIGDMKNKLTANECLENYKHARQLALSHVSVEQALENPEYMGRVYRTEAWYTKKAIEERKYD